MQGKVSERLGEAPRGFTSRLFARQSVDRYPAVLLTPGQIPPSRLRAAAPSPAPARAGGTVCVDITELYSSVYVHVCV